MRRDVALALVLVSTLVGAPLAAFLLAGGHMDPGSWTTTVATAAGLFWLILGAAWAFRQG